MTADQLEREALKLSATQRARLAKLLLASLEEPAKFDEEWLSEAKRRDAELDAGNVEGVPGAAVREKAESRFGV